MQILVKTLSGWTITVEAESSDRIEKVKAKIRYKGRIGTEKLILVYDGQLLEDGKTLSDYNIKHGTTVYLVIRLRGGMQIFVQTLTGKTMTLEVESSDTVSEVKRKIEINDGTPVRMQKLLLDRHRLQDGATLSDSRVCSGSTLCLVRNLAVYYDIVKLKK